MDIKARLNELENEMVADLSDLVAIDSVEGPAKEGMPFGEGPAKVLAKALEISERMGFKTKNLDNYCGYAEIGQGEEIIGLVAHLDTVPCGEGWNTDPLKVTNIDGILYGRGVTDDKGGAVASLYTLKILKELGIPLNKRIRLIFGCNEETGMHCMEHYNEVEEPLSAGFTPDGSFPGVYGEKGHMNLLVTSKNTKIISMEGGMVTNAVCNRCLTKVPATCVDKEKLAAAFRNTPLKGFEINEADGVLTIDAVGVLAHASTPLLGINAASYTFWALKEAGMQDDFVDYYVEHVGTACNGEGYNLNIEDEYGDLTFNNGIVETEDGVIKCNIDIRYPVTYNEEKIREILEGRLEDEKGKCEILNIGNPLFFDPESKLVKTLHEAYIKITGDTEHKPFVMGGGTYAKAIPGIIAFGCEFPDKDYHIHDANELIPISELKEQAEIYTEAVKNLVNG